MQPRGLPPLAQVLAIVGLGAFWGISPTFYKLMANEHIPVSHIIVFSGIGVGTGLGFLRWLTTGRKGFTRAEILYGLGCGLLQNVPFAMGLWLAKYLPVTVFAVISSMAPFCSYALALALRREGASQLRILALFVGFASSATLILTRQTATDLSLSSWTLLALLPTALYAVYGMFASMAWPKGMDTLTAGSIESWASATIALPFLLVLQPVHGIGDFHWGYWTLGVITLIWTIERIAYFTMIQRSGPVTTSQAVYVSSPASVLFGATLFGERIDVWLIACLGLLLVALYLNNRALSAAKRVSAAAT
ncbi:MAG: DMT family transporter [Hyphomicrobiaceae bacterium]